MSAFASKISENFKKNLDFPKLPWNFQIKILNTTQKIQKIFRLRAKRSFRIRRYRLQSYCTPCIATKMNSWDFLHFSSKNLETFYIFPVKVVHRLKSEILREDGYPFRCSTQHLHCPQELDRRDQKRMAIRTKVIGKFIKVATQNESFQKNYLNWIAGTKTNGNS